ncbi:unnamed protein product [Strongylus vulgaris]|uniref:Uncharacterized protein n=1 Tax=Strongylus vulgaris TaxID=40348 RepID=A0A3P7IUU7_STRVU|nr:unnamed protein product [Strongylus vulgaris]
MSHVGGILQKFEQQYELVNHLYQTLGDRGIFFYDYTRPLAHTLCNMYLTNPICIDILIFINGPKSDQFNATRAGIYLSHSPAGTSTRNMRHYAQMVRTNRMASFDHGVEENLRCYGTYSPPEYDVSRVHSDIYVFYSDHDWVVSAEDVEQNLLPSLPSTSVKLIRYSIFTYIF